MAKTIDQMILDGKVFAANTLVDGDKVIARDVSDVTDLPGGTDKVLDVDELTKLNTVRWKGLWNASTNTPTIANGDANSQGNLFIVSVGADRDLGAGTEYFRAGWIIYHDGTQYKYLGARAVANAANLKKTIGYAGSLAVLEAYSGSDSTRSGIFYWSASGTADDIDVFAVNSGTDGYWHRAAHTSAGQTYTTDQTGFVPPVAVGGKWRIVRNVDFQQGLTMTSQDWVKFSGCQFGARVLLTSCDHVIFDDECYWDTVSSTVGALTLDDCKYVEVSGWMETPAYDGVRVIDTTAQCKWIELKDLFVKDPCLSAAAMTTVSIRDQAFEATSNFYDPGVIHAGVMVKGALNVVMENVKVTGSERTGVCLQDCEHVRGDRVYAESCGKKDTASSVSQVNDSGIVVYDCKRVWMDHTSSIDYYRYGVLLKESTAAYDTLPGHSLRDVHLNGLLVEAYPTTKSVSEAVHDPVADTGSQQVINTAITQPPIPAKITATVTGTVAGDVGAITVTIDGTDTNDNSQQEVLPAFTANTFGGVVGTKTFKTVTQITIPAHDGTNVSTSVGYGTYKSHGVYTRGGRYLYVENALLQRCGQSGLEMGTGNPTDDLTLLNVTAVDNGYSDDVLDSSLVHRDGISLVSGRRPMIIGGRFDDNNRSGLQGKPQINGFSEYTLTDLQVIGLTTIGNGYQHGYYASAATGIGNGILLTSETVESEFAGQRARIVAAVSYGNKQPNLVVNSEWHDCEMIGFTSGWKDDSGTLSGVRLERCHNIRFVGGIFDGWDNQTGGAIAVRSDAGDALGCYVLGGNFRGTDWVEKNWQNSLSAFNNYYAGGGATSAYDDSATIALSMAQATATTGAEKRYYTPFATDVTIPAESTTAVHAAITGTGAPQMTNTGITDPQDAQTPATPRSVTVTLAGTGIISGTVRITGTLWDDSSTTEDIAVSAAATYQGVKVWKTVTQIDDLTGQPATATYSIGTGELTALSAQHPDKVPAGEAGDYGMYLDAETGSNQTETCVGYCHGDNFELGTAYLRSAGVLVGPQQLTARGGGDWNSFTTGILLANGGPFTVTVTDDAKRTDADGGLTTGDWILNTSGDSTEIAGWIVDASNIAQSIKAVT